MASHAIVKCSECELVHPCTQVLERDKVTGRIAPRYLCRDHCYKVWSIAQDEKRREAKTNGEGF